MPKQTQLTTTTTATAMPKNHQIFDPWNSASGHQRSDGPTLAHTTSWRGVRNDKLQRQFLSGDCAGGGAGAGGEGRGEWTWVKEGEEENSKRGRDIRSYMGSVQKRKRDDTTADEEEGGLAKWSRRDTNTNTPTPIPTSQSQLTDPKLNPNPEPEPEPEPGKPLAGSTIYINGSTMPFISDHKLKHLLVVHGAKLSLALARNTVTHVIIGRPNTGVGPVAGAGTATATGIGIGPRDKGAGGGLAATKLQKEIQKCGKGVKVVGVEWALESIKAQKRLSETRFALNLAPKGQPSVLGMFR